MTTEADAQEPQSRGQVLREGLKRTLKLAVVVLIAMPVIGVVLYKVVLDKAEVARDEYVKNGDWDDSLTDFNGVWRGQQGEYSVQLMLYFNEKGSAQGFTNGDRLLTVKAIDTQTGDATVTISATSLKDIQQDRKDAAELRKAGRPILPAEMTLQRIWDADHKSFTIVAVKGTLTTRYGFVRRLTPAETAQFADVRSRAAAAVEQDKAASAPSSPAKPSAQANASDDADHAAEFPGEYNYVESTCCDGGISIARAKADNWAVNINTVTKEDAHVCNLETEEARQISSTRIAWAEGACAIMIDVTGGGASVATQGNDCSSNCGTGASFEGRYRKK